MEEYVVTLRNKEDLDDFYNDMETPGGDLYIPDVTCQSFFLQECLLKKYPEFFEVRGLPDDFASSISSAILPNCPVPQTTSTWGALRRINS